MKPFPCFADALCEHRLYKAVYILGLLGYDKSPFGYILPYGNKTVYDLFTLIGGNDTLLPQHPRTPICTSASPASSTWITG